MRCSTEHQSVHVQQLPAFMLTDTVLLELANWCEARFVYTGYERNWDSTDNFDNSITQKIFYLPVENQKDVSSNLG